MSSEPEPAIWVEVQKRPGLILTERALVYARLGTTPENLEPSQASDSELQHVLETIASDFDERILALQGIDELRGRLESGWRVTQIRLSLTGNTAECMLVKEGLRETHRFSGSGAHLGAQLLGKGLPLPGAPKARARVEEREPKVILRVGDVDLSKAIIGKIRLWSEQGLPGGEVTLAADLLEACPFDYLGEAQILARREGREIALFTGLVDRVTHGEQTSKLDLVSVGKPFTEMGIGGLGVGKGIDPLELIWSLMVSSGMHDDRIDIEGFHPGPVEDFEVIVPLEALVIDRPMIVGEVALTADRRLRKLSGRLGPRELRKAYRSAPAWARVLVEERTLWEAEIAGSALIASALSWMTANAHYSYSKKPNGELAPFDRDWFRTRIHHGDVILVRGLSSGRIWLRSPTGIVYVPPAQVGELSRFTPRTDFASFAPQFREALHAWHRAATSSDPIAAVNGLWEAIEFYVAGVQLPALFDKAQLRRIRANALKGLSDEQASRVKDRLSEVNSPPLMIRLRAALEKYGVPHTDSDLEILRRVRTARNEFQHGRSRTPPAEADVRQALGFLNRVVVHSACTRGQSLG